jgi:hypothetical protein
MEKKQKRKATGLSATDFEATSCGSAGSVGTAYMDSSTGPRRENGKIVPRHLLVFHTPEEKIIHLKVEYTVRIGDIYKQIEECVGYPVFLQQTEGKKKTVILDPDEIAEDGMHFGYSVQVKRRKPKLESHFAENVAHGRRSWAGRLHEIPGVLRAAAPSPAEPAKEASSAKKHKERKEPNPPAEPAKETSSAKKDKERKEPDAPDDAKTAKEAKRPRNTPPAWAPRGVPGGHFVAQFPIEYDADGNQVPTKYQNVYWHQGM